ncbi:MAG: aspartate/glutamate racemase family protein [Candidatus Sumerlaeia bacterium]|nr:aspartate/glutamate racemase family protein [Candidatus Sumerlaeia bacterium]
MLNFARRLTLLGMVAGLMLAGGLVHASDLKKLAAKEELTIVVTDSGLGGLSVVADIARRAEELKTHKKLHVVFYNALFDADSGYNSLPTREDRVRIFNNALVDMGTRFDADLIMVACNTLSVLLPDCEYAQSGEVPILGIVESGVELMEEAFNREPEAKVILFATPVTVEEDSHRSELVARGVDDDRLVLQACPELTFYIEQEFDGFETELMISAFVNEAAAKLGDPSIPVYASFNCTHFGYSADLWESEFKAAGLTLRGMINPNDQMANFLFGKSLHNRAEDPSVTVDFVTMVPISDAAVASISRAVQNISPRTAQALKDHELIPDLFPWKE